MDVNKFSTEYMDLFLFKSSLMLASELYSSTYVNSGWLVIVFQGMSVANGFQDVLAGSGLPLFHFRRIPMSCLSLNRIETEVPVKMRFH